VRRSGTRRASCSAALGVGLALLLCTAAQGAVRWQVDSATSQLTFVATQAGGEFVGRFPVFTPDIVFDPADLAHSKFSVDIATSAAITGEAERDKLLRGADFFATGQWPNAHFETRSFRAVAGGTYEATGILTLRNVSRELRLPVSFKPARDGRTAVLTGTATLLRLDFGVGQGEWADTRWVGNEVVIRFALTLVRLPHQYFHS